MKNTLLITSLFVLLGLVSTPAAFAIEFSEIQTNAPLSGQGPDHNALVGDFFAAQNAYDLANSPRPTSNATTTSTTTTTSSSPFAMNTYVPVRQETVRNTTNTRTVVVRNSNDRVAYATDGYNAETTKLNYGANQFALGNQSQYQASVIQSRGNTSFVNGGGLLLVFALLFGVLWYVRRRYYQRKALAYQYVGVPAHDPYYLEGGYEPRYR